MSILLNSNIDEKINLVERECHTLLTSRGPSLKMSALGVERPARSLPIVASQAMPPRAGLQTAEGQARLLHNLANIELQAMELGVRTLYEFADAATEFREGLAHIVLDEARHLKLCLDGLRSLGFNWGRWPAHNTLWDATDESDSLLDRILIVNCYLEGSGLDSGELILKHLSGVASPLAREIVKVIAEEEVGHVQFGLRWYRNFCAKEKLNSSDDFERRLNLLFLRLPARAAAINERVRAQAGFTATEISAVQKFTQAKIERARFERAQDASRL